MERKLTLLDRDQITRYAYDEENSAHRVIIAGDLGIAESVKEGLKDLKVEVSVKETPKEEPSAPIIVKVPEIIYVEKPMVVEKVDFRTVEKPVIVKEIEYREIEKPIIVREPSTEPISVRVESEGRKNKLFEIAQLSLLALIALALFIK